MSEIIRARELLIEYLMDHTVCPERERLKEVLALMTREPVIRKAPKKAPTVTAATRDYIKMIAAKYPKFSFMELAHIHEEKTGYWINSGRISEILNGKYDRLK
jgi:hypothetical protein